MRKHTGTISTLQDHRDHKISMAASAPATAILAASSGDAQAKAKRRALVEALARLAARNLAAEQFGKPGGQKPPATSRPENASSRDTDQP